MNSRRDILRIKMDNINFLEDRGKEYFEKHRYRDPAEKVVFAYVLPKVRFILANIPLDMKSSILDVGCGNGTFTYYFKEMFKQTYGIDASPSQLKMNGYSKLACSTVYNLPFGDSSFDLVFSANLLHHLDNPALAIIEMKRVSKRYLCFVEANCLNPFMFMFSMVVPEERGQMKSLLGRWKRLAMKSGLRIINSINTGMITQQNTPSLFVPFLKYFDFNFIFGAYSVLICEIDKKNK